ncbi:RHS repeat-associated core domain-containing protein [Streptomyces anulatus]|uniref:RHS repeat domain-containing protein n=1 Tax=Streptomyces anulatus TaxID=1892 RepID=UPI0034297E1E
MPNRSKSGGDSPSTKYAYGLERDKAPWTSVATLKAGGTSYTTAYSLLDLMLRPVQTQGPSPNGGRILTDTRYDSRGLADETYADVYDKDNAPSSTYAKVPYGGGSQTLTDYDGAGRATKSTFMVNGVKKWDTTTTYTGDSTATTAPAGGNASRTITDVLGRVKETRTYAGTQPDDTQYGATLGTPYNRVAHIYTRDGKQETITGIDDSKWSYTYDLFGRQRTATDPDKGKTVTGYTELDQLDSITDSENKVLLYEHDELGRKTKQWQTSRTDANLQAEWTFDSITGAKGLPVASTRHEAGKGQTGSKAYTKQITAYDALSRATTTTLTLPSTDALVTSGAVTATSTTEVAYRLDGTLQSITAAAGGGLAAEKVTADYNADSGRITGLSGASGYLLGASYTSLGQVAQLQLGTSTAASTKRVFQTNTYEAGTGRLLTAATDDQTRGPVQDLKYTYDPAGNVIATADPADTGAGTDNQCYSYDEFNRLTEAWTPKTANCAITGRTTANLGGPAPYWTTYTYTTAGQRKTEKQNAGTPTTRTYCYNDPAHPHGATATTTSATCTGVAAQYIYDKTGNTTTRVEKAGSSTTQSLQWNAEGKPVKLTEGSTATDYVYDADGELLIRRGNATSGETVLYLGDTEVHLKSGKRWANRYYSAAGSTIAIRSNETGTEKLSFLAADRHNTASIAITADSTQTLNKRYTTPFGSARGTTTGTWPDDKSFLGKTDDKATGLTHIGAREYDPSIGQFISVDPLLEKTKHQTLNGYSYAANNPVTFSDPAGICLDPGNGRCQPGSGGGNNSDPAFPTNASDGDVNLDIDGTLSAGLGSSSSPPRYFELLEVPGYEPDGFQEAFDRAYSLISAERHRAGMPNIQIMAVTGSDICWSKVECTAEQRGYFAFYLFHSPPGFVESLVGHDGGGLAAAPVKASAGAAGAAGISKGRAAERYGKGYESFLVNRLGGGGQFKEKGREFDGAYINPAAGRGTWYEAKSGSFWESILRKPDRLAKWKSTKGQKSGIARDRGIDFRVISENEIPPEITSWLNK